MSFNPNVTIYIGDFKLNPDSHHFVTDWEDRFLGSTFGFSKAIPVVDIDYLGLDSKVIQKVVHEASKPVILCTLYASKIDSKLDCKITYKDNVSDSKDQLIWNVIKRCFHSKDRFKLSQELKESNISVHVLNMWLQSNPTPENIGILKLLDRKNLIANAELWIDFLALKLLDGPSYPKYKYRKRV